MRAIGRTASTIRARSVAWIAIAATALLACSARTDAAAAQPGSATRTDSIRPAAPPGEPAASFPAPTREVADIVAPRWTDEGARESAGEFARVAKLAGVRAGMHVADIGAGDGYYVARLSLLVGETGRVYGNDIIHDYLVLLYNRVAREKLHNVQVVLGDAHDPRLPAGDVEVATMIHMYHEIEQPFGLLWNLATAMKPAGRLVILDLDRKTYAHGTPPALLRCELNAIGYRELSFTRTGTEEYVAIFEAPTVNAPVGNTANTRPTPSAIRARLAASPCRG